MRILFLALSINAEDHYKCKNEESGITITCYGRCTTVIATDKNGLQIKVPRCDCGAGYTGNSCNESRCKTSSNPSWGSYFSRVK